MKIDGRDIGPKHPPYVVAELSSNHGGSLDRASEMVRAAATAGADAVKLQTYTPDTMTIDCDRPWFRIGPGTIWEGRTLYDLYTEAQTPWHWHEILSGVAKEEGLHFFSTPFDETAIDLLEELQVPAYKIASFELVHIPLLERVAATGRPVILSTGMSTEAEIQEAISVLRQGRSRVSLLVCTSSYPAQPVDMNLTRITRLADVTGLPVGLSDHSLERVVPIAAVALGACIIEKHFTLSRRDPSPDCAFSLEPKEFADMTRAVRMAWKSLGEGSLGVSEKERAGVVFRRSLFAVEDLEAGEAFTHRNVRCIRPGHGLHPRHLEEILGARAMHRITRGSPLEWSMIEGGSRTGGGYDPIAGEP